MPPAPWCVQIDAVEQGPEGCGIKGDPCGPVRDRRTLEGTTQKPLLPDHPSGAVEVEALGELAAAGILIEDGPEGTRWRRAGQGS